MSSIWIEEPIVNSCQLCLSKDNVKDICLGVNKQQAGYQRICLCENCRALLAVKSLKSIEE